MTFTPKAIEAALDAFNGCKSSNDIDAMQAALSAALAVDGLALVPVEPSAEMLCAAVPFPLLLVKERNDPQYTKNMEAACLVERAVARQVYRTMLAAASDREERR